jgi:hypothetical protein
LQGVLDAERRAVESVRFYTLWQLPGQPVTIEVDTFPMSTASSRRAPGI